MNLSECEGVGSPTQNNSWTIFMPACQFLKVFFILEVKKSLKIFSLQISLNWVKITIFFGIFHLIFFLTLPLLVQNAAIRRGCIGRHFYHYTTCLAYDQLQDVIQYKITLLWKSLGSQEKISFLKTQDNWSRWSATSGLIWLQENEWNQNFQKGCSLN